MGTVYPEIAESRERARRLITREEETFRRTLRDGERRLNKVLDGLTAAGEKVLLGDSAFELNDTYGFPSSYKMVPECVNLLFQGIHLFPPIAPAIIFPLSCS